MPIRGRLTIPHRIRVVAGAEILLYVTCVWSAIGLRVRELAGTSSCVRDGAVVAEEGIDGEGNAD